MDHLLERIQTLEQHVQSLQQQTTSVARRLRWWRRLASSMAVLTVLSLPVSVGGAKDDDDKVIKGLAQRVRALERKLQHVTSERDENGLPAFIITGANLRIVNGLGRTECTDEQGNPISGCPNGLGNLIVGYNELRSEIPEFCIGFFDDCGDRRTGSHNIVVGRFHNFSSVGGLVAGFGNEISGEFASVSGGVLNVAGGAFASVSGGFFNGAFNFTSSVSGGAANVASGVESSVSGGIENSASGEDSSVSGGAINSASGFASSVSGGISLSAAGVGEWVAGAASASSFSSDQVNSIKQRLVDRVNSIKQRLERRQGPQK
jgi:hypothetical protein